MKDFINNLYNSDNFILYLSIAIGILVILFIIVYFCGRKDEKLEDNKKGKFSSLKSFKEENKEITEENKLEVKDNLQNPLIVEDETEVLPVINEEDKQKNEVTTIVFEPIEDDTDSNFNDPHMEQLADNLEKELNDLAKIKEEFNRIDISKDINDSDNQVINTTSANDSNTSDDLDDDFELPTLKEDRKD